MNMAKATIYTRVSSDEQIKGFSLGEQEEKGKQYIKLNDWDFLKTYRDEGVSGITLNRPSLELMFKEAKLKKFDVLIIYKIDRLSRNLKDFLDIVKKLNDFGVEIRSITEQFDTSTPAGRLFMQQL